MNTSLNLDNYNVSILNHGDIPYVTVELQVRLVESYTGDRPQLRLQIGGLGSLLPCEQCEDVLAGGLVWDTSAATVQAHALKIAEHLDTIAARLRAEVPNLIGR